MPRKLLKPWEKAGLSPTQRCYRWLEMKGYDYAGASGYNAATKQRWDTMGIIDFWAMGYGRLVGIQTTSGAHHADHKIKMLASEWTPRLLEVPGVEVWLFTWSELVGGWTPRIEVMTKEMFDETEI